MKGSYSLAGTRLANAAVLAGSVSERELAPSLEERCPSHGEYVNAVATAASGLGRDCLLLEEDVHPYIKNAEAAAVGK